MKRFWLAATGLAIASGIVMPSVVERAIAFQASGAIVVAQSPSPSPTPSPSPQATPSPAATPAAPRTASPRRPRPVARINPSRPVQIRVVNPGDATVIATLTQPTSAERRVPPGGSTTFGSTTQNFLPLPIEMVIYPVDPKVAVAIDVAASNNVVEVIVSQQLSSGSTGNLAVSIESNGDIFRY
jgi:hypothetical protein